MSLPWAKQLLGQNETQRRNHTSAIHTHTQQAMWQRVMGSYAASFPTFLSPMLKLRPLLFFWWQKLPPHWPSSKQCLCDKIKLMFSPSSCWFSEKGFLPFCFSTCLLAFPPPLFLEEGWKRKPGLPSSTTTKDGENISNGERMTVTLPRLISNQ